MARKWDTRKGWEWEEENNRRRERFSQSLDLYLGKKYVGKTRHKIVTCGHQHKRAGLTAHKNTDAPADCDDPTILAMMHYKNNWTLDHNLKIREALEIMHHDCGKGPYEDNGNHVKTDIWRPVFGSMLSLWLNALSLPIVLLLPRLPFLLSLPSLFF